MRVVCVLPQKFKEKVGIPPIVIPAEAGIQVFFCLDSGSRFHHRRISLKLKLSPAWPE